MATDSRIRILQLDKKEKEDAKKTKFFDRRARLWISSMLLVADVVAFSTAAFLAIAVRVLFNDVWRLDLFPQVVPIMLISLLFYSLVGLYPAVGLSAVDELRKLVSTTSLIVLAFAALSFWVRNVEDYSRMTLGLTWAFSLALLPLAREAMRTICVRLDLWGEPVALIGYGKQGQWALDFFQNRRNLGLRPVVVLDFTDAHAAGAKKVLFIQVTDELLASGLAELTGVETALVITADIPANFMNRLSGNTPGGFRRLILIPNLEQITSYGVIPFDFGGVLGLEISHNLLNKSQQIMKRLVDVLLAVVGGLFILPFLVVIAVLLKLDSRGSLFYGHARIGKDGREFKAWKFRTMILDADRKLEEYLAKNPEMRLEWEADHKLRNDPRITRLGKYLRRFSLDELPQLWNVIKGEMSLVGPRPIVRDEIQHYGDRFDPYTWVRPGITGLWQVSGRNDTTYLERVSLDEYYVRNWSIWLDIYILARTLTVVLQRKGAY
jgi:Undecaprenyl-phosphate galactose phosphotransferase WbaP